VTPPAARPHPAPQQAAPAGRTYLEQGRPVVVVLAWATGRTGTPRNVLVRRADGTLVVRPFRGLRRT
jgi:hypothetical protein